MEAEYFAVGAEGVAFHNISKGEPAATANVVRYSPITVQALDTYNPASGRYVLGWTGAGEWMNYKVQ